MQRTDATELFEAPSAEDGRRYVEQRTKPGVIVQLPRSAARAWDLRAVLPT